MCLRTFFNSIPALSPPPSPTHILPSSFFRRQRILPSICLAVTGGMAKGILHSWPNMVNPTIIWLLCICPGLGLFTVSRCISFYSAPWQSPYPLHENLQSNLVCSWLSHSTSKWEQSPKWMTCCIGNCFRYRTHVSWATLVIQTYKVCALKKRKL